MKPPRSPYLHLVKHWEHHTFSGGYHRLANEMAVEQVGRRQVPILDSRVARFAWNKFFPARRHLFDYTYEDWLAEWNVLATVRLRRPVLVHALYGDEQLDVLLRQRRLLPCPLIATIHHASSYLRKRFEVEERHLLQRIDAAIVLARSQMPDLQKWLGPDRVYFVPHGVDTVHFCPGKPWVRGDAVRLLFVGEHMRDWESLHRIIDECRHLRLPVEIDAVIRPNCVPYFAGCTNVRLHIGIAEDDLIELYRGADALLLPLTDATANNAILESLACGTPVIATDVGGVPDYLDEASGWLFPPGDVEGIIALIRRMGEDRKIAEARRDGARAKALTFDWRQVCDQTRAVYARWEGRA